MSTQFEPGAPTAKDVIPLCIPEMNGNEWQYVKECLDAGWVSSVGSYVDRFEANVASYVGTPYAVAMANGTSALHIALLVAGVEPDDEVLVSDLTFIAPVNAIRYAGAWPVLIDAEPLYWEMDTQKVHDFLNHECEWRNNALYNKTTHRRIKAIMPVHILGHPVDIEPLLELARKYNLVVIEDATESLGAKYQGRMVGHLGDVACFSFNGNKIITTGGGGMLVTDNKAWADKAKYLTTQAKDDALEYVHHEIGYNYRLTNLQAAMGVAQMELLDSYIAKKRQIAQRYNEAFHGIKGITVMPQAAWAESVFWMYTILIDETQFGLHSRAVLKQLQAKNIQTRPLWHPIHLNKPYHSSPAYQCQTVLKLYDQALSLPCSVGLTSSQQNYVIEQLTQLR